MESREKKTILILTGPMGSGHVRAALALKENFQKRYPDDHVIYEDSTVWMTPPVRWIFLHFYPFLLSYLPFCWRMIHDSHKHIEKFLFISFFFISNRRGKKYIQDIVSRKKADLIISTHFYPGYIADEMKRKGMLSIPAALVITDHAGHRIYVRKHHDLIFVPSKDAVEQFVKYGIKREQLRITGCPVSFKFGCSYTESDLCRFRRELTLKENRCYVMLCMGGWATGGMCAAAKSILQADKDFTLLVMTAHNAELFRRFAQMAAEDDRIQPIAYTDQIEKYMALCSFVITKPGGITTSECIAMQKPMLLVNPIAGHEEENMKYLIEHGLGIAPYPNESLADAGKRLKTLREKIIAEMREYAPLVIHASSFIADESRALIPQ